MQKLFDEEHAKKYGEEPDSGLLENIVHTGLTEMSAAQANSFLKQKAIDHSHTSPKR